MQTMKRMLAILLVLAMTLSNLPVAVLAEELSELTAEQTIETIAEETTVETTEAPTETPTEAPTEAATEAPTEAPTEAATEETEVPAEETSAPDEVTEPAEETEQEDIKMISRDAMASSSGLPFVGFYTSEIPSLDSILTGDTFYVNPYREVSFYYYFNKTINADSGCNYVPNEGSFTVDHPDWVEVEQISDCLFKLTLTKEARLILIDGTNSMDIYCNLDFTNYWTGENGQQTVTQESACCTIHIWVDDQYRGEESHNPHLVFKWLSVDEDGNWFEEADADLKDNFAMLPKYPFWMIIYAANWVSSTGKWNYTPVSIDELSYDSDHLSIDPVTENVTGANQNYYMMITPDQNAWDIDDNIAYVDNNGTLYCLPYHLGPDNVQFYLDSNCYPESADSRLYVNPDAEENVFWWEFKDYGENLTISDLTWTTNLENVTLDELVRIETIEENCKYKFTLTDTAIERALNNGSYCIQSFSLVTDEDGRGEYIHVPIYIYPPVYDNPSVTTEGRIVHDYVRNHGKGFFAENSTVTGLTVCPGDQYEVIFYYATLDEETHQWVKQYPVHVESDLFDIVPMNLGADEIKEGEENAEYFCRVVSNEWDKEGTFWAQLEDGSTITNDCRSFENEFTFHSEPNRDHDSYMPLWPIYFVDPNAEENAFYLTFDSGYWNIENIYIDENDWAANLEDLGDGIYKITLTEEGVASALDQYGLRINHQLAAKDGSGDTMPGDNYIQIYPQQFLSFGWLEERGEGWYEDAEKSGWDKQYGIRPGEEFFHIYYLNTWNPETREYDREPVQVHSASDNLYLESIAGHAREDQENASCFYRVITDKWDMNTSVYAEVDGGRISMPVYTGLGDSSFHTSATRSTSNFIRDFYVDPFKSENSFYFHFVSDWQIDEIRPAPGCEDLFTISHVKEQIFKITLTEKGVGRSVSTGWYMELEYDVSNPWDRQTWRDGVYSCISEEFRESQIAFFAVDYQHYDVLEDGILRLYWDEEGNGSCEVVDSLPKGITYNAKSNKVTLNNANYQSLIFTRNDNGEEEALTNLPSENLTIELKGTNSLRSDVDVAFMVRGLNVTFTGSGTLNVKGVNSLNNTYFDGEQELPYEFPAFVAQNSTVTFKDSVKVNVEIEGEARQSLWNENGFMGTRPAHLMAINAESSEIIVTGKATLKTILPNGARANGEILPEGHEDIHWDDRTPGGYTGIGNFEKLLVSGGTLDTQQINVPEFWDEHGNLMGAGSFVQTGGKVHIVAQGHNEPYEIWEWDEEAQEHVYDRTEESVFFTAIRGGLGTVDISGGEMTLDVRSNYNGLAEISALCIDGGTLNISGGFIEVLDNCPGVVIQVRDWEHNGFHQKGTLNVSDGEIEIPGVYDEDRETRAIDLFPGNTANFTGGTLKLLGSDLFFGGEVNWDGTELYGNNTDIHFDGKLTMDSGLVCTNEESIIYFGMADINGGTVDAMDTCVMVNGGLIFNGGEMIISNDRQGPSWASLIVRTYMEVNNDARLLIQHNMWPEAMVVEGTFQQQGGEVVIKHYSEMGSPAVSVVDGWNDQGETHGTFTMLDGDFIVEAEISLSAREARREMQELDENAEVWLFAFDTHENSIVDIYGGNISINAHNFDDAFHNGGDYYQKGGRVAVFATADDRYQMYDIGAFASNGNVVIEDGELLLNSQGTGLGYDALRGGSMEITDGSIYINADAVGMWINGETEISGGYIGIDINGIEVTDEEGQYLLARAMIVNGYDEGPGALTVTGGYFEINTPTEIPADFDPVYPRFLTANLAPVKLLGGTFDLNTNIPLFFLNTDSTPDYEISEDLVIYSRTTGNRLVLLENEFDEGDQHYYCVMLEEDNNPGDLNTDEGVDYLRSAVITSGKAGGNTNWKVEDGVLKFDGTGGMYDFTAENPAPWVKLSDFITTVEIDNNLTSIGAYAFNGLKKLSTINFLGNPPTFDENAFAGIKADAFVLMENMPNWSAEAMQNYGGEIDWINKYPDESIGDVTVDKTKLLAGEKATLTATLYPGNDRNAKVEWTLSEGDKNYVTLKVLSDGSATVTAKKNKEFRQVTVITSVKGIANSAVETYIDVLPVVTKVTILDAEGNAFTEMPVLAMGTDTESIQLTAVNAPEYSLQEVTWKSSNEKFVSVDEDGVITAVMPGKTATITATAKDGSGKKATLKVKTIQPVTGIKLDGEAVLAAGKSISLKAEVVPAEATNKKVTWDIVEDVDFVSISNGKLKASKTIPDDGATVTVRVTSQENSDIYAECEVTLYPVVTAVSITADEYEGVLNGMTIELDMSEGGLQLYAENTPSGAAQAWTWTSSKDSFISVDAEGYVTANPDQPGKTVTITATAADGSGKKATVKVKSVLPVEEITLSGTTVAAAGKTVALTATVEPAKATNNKLVWTIESGEEAATISNGKLKVNKAAEDGTVITVRAAVADDLDTYAEWDISVYGAAVNKVYILNSENEDITGDTIEVEMSTEKINTFDLYAKTLDKSLTDASAQEVTWKSSNANYVEVNQDGEVTFKVPGKQVTITATAGDGSGKKATIKIKGVQPVEDLDLKEDILVDAEGEIFVAGGKSLKLANYVEIYPSFATNKKLTWTVEVGSKYGVKINKTSGVLSTKKVTEMVTATIRAEAQDGSGYAVEFDVNIYPATAKKDLTIWMDYNGADTADYTGKTLEMAVGETAQLEVKCKTAGTAGVYTWKSSNEGYATVDAEGNVTIGDAVGKTVTITVTAADGSGINANIKFKIVENRKTDFSDLSDDEREMATAEIRRALSLLIDRNEVSMGQVPASSFVSTGFTDADGSQFYQNAGDNSYPGYWNTESYEANCEEAMEILSKYFDVDERGRLVDFPAISYIYNEGSGHEEIAEMIQYQLASFGIRLNLKSQEWNTFLNTRQVGDYELARHGWIADYNDPINMLDMWTSYSGNNDAQLGRGTHGDAAIYDLDLTPWGFDIEIENGTWAETYDVLIEVIKNCGTDPVRYELMHLAEDMVMESGCIVPLYYYSDLYTIRNYVTGFGTNPTGMKFFQNTTVSGRNDSISVCMGSEPETMDPALVTTVDTSSMIQHLFAGLARWAPDASGSYTRIEADCAKELVAPVVNADGTVTYTYTLRDGIAWSDGVAVTAHDFEFAWKRAASSALGAGYGYMFEQIKGYPDNLAVTAKDDKTLVVTLKRNIAHWNEMLAFSAFMPVREDVVANGEWASSAETYVCNGAYTMTSWEHESMMIAQKNDNYWDAENISMEGIRFHLGADIEEAWKNGILDFVDDKVSGYSGLYASNLGTYFLIFNANLELLP